jgi:hypothetical protein
VYIDSDGSFTMNGGTISRNTTFYYVSYNPYSPASYDNPSGDGGGVYVGTPTQNRKGSFIMNGGVISGNSARIGGGVRVWGDFTKTGGIIYGNDAGEYIQNWASPQYGAAIYAGGPKRDTTVGADQNLSTVDMTGQWSD